MVDEGRSASAGEADLQAQAALAERLRLSRAKLRLSQQTVADNTGIPRSAISDIERGERRVDSLELKKFAVVYGQSVEYLLNGTQPDDAGSFQILARAHAGMTGADRDKLLAFAQFLRHSAALDEDQDQEGS